MYIIALATEKVVLQREGDRLILLLRRKRMMVIRKRKLINKVLDYGIINSFLLDINLLVYLLII